MVIFTIGIDENEIQMHYIVSTTYVYAEHVIDVNM